MRANGMLLLLWMLLVPCLHAAGDGPGHSWVVDPVESLSADMLSRIDSILTQHNRNAAVPLYFVTMNRAKQRDVVSQKEKLSLAGSPEACWILTQSVPDGEYRLVYQGEPSGVYTREQQDCASATITRLSEQTGLRNTDTLQAVQLAVQQLTSLPAPPSEASVRNNESSGTAPIIAGVVVFVIMLVLSLLRGMHRGYRNSFISSLLLHHFLHRPDHSMTGRKNDPGSIFGKNQGGFPGGGSIGRW